MSDLMTIEKPSRIDAETAVPTVSILMVNYNTRDVTLRALETLYANTPDVEFETILVDNNSRDGSADAIAERYPQVTLIRSPENLGFGRANNLAARSARGDWILLLNPDTETNRGAIRALLDFGKAHPGGGIYGGRTVFPDGRLNIGSCWGRMSPWSLFCKATGLAVLFPRIEFFSPETIGGYDRDHVREVDIVSGCFLLIRKELWDRLGGFDEAFFLYGEDSDLSLRARRLGFRPMVTPDAVIMHLVGASSNDRIDRIVLHVSVSVQLIRRHFSPVWRGFGLLLVKLEVFRRAALFKLLAVVAPGRYQARADLWSGVWRERARWKNG